MGQMVEPKPKTTLSGKPMKLKRRYELWLDDPRCFWCETETVLYIPDYNETAPTNMATLDHIFTRLDGNRSSNTGSVLACLRCNWLRGKAREGLLFPEEQDARVAQGVERKAQKKFTNPPRWK